MKSMLRRRPSAALVIACIALFVSLGGVSYAVATGSIDSREIKNNSVLSTDVRNNTLRTFDIRNNEVRGFDIRNSTVQGRDVALNTLTGADVDEANLAKVPAAAQADSATAAATVGGMTVRKFFAKPASGAAVAEVFRGDGFVVEAACPGGAVVLQLDAIAGTPAPNVTVAGSADGAGADIAIFESEDALIPGTELSLLGGQTEAAGTATVSTSAGAVATIVYGAESASAFPGEAVCAVRGTVTSG